MRITIYQPECFNEIGGRSNNEDSVYPLQSHASANDRLFLVCDGVGGQHKGEVASALVCQCLPDYFQKNPASTIDKDYLKAALVYVHDKLQKRELEDAESAGMATTLTLLYLGDDGITVAHVGDSRVYQLRNGTIIFKTEDHSQVNELVKLGRITPQEALSHPNRNQITRAVSADRNDEASVAIITDIQANDYFFLCTDGVLEQIYDELLEYHLREGDDNQISDAEKLANIKQECLTRTRDNFSAYLIHLASIAGTTAPSAKQEPPMRDEKKMADKSAKNNETDNLAADSRPIKPPSANVILDEKTFIHRPTQAALPSPTPRTKKQKSALPFIIPTLSVVAIAGVIGYFMFGKQKQSDAKEKAVVVDTTAMSSPTEIAALKTPSTIKNDENIISKKYEFSFTKKGNKWYRKTKNQPEKLVQLIQWKEYGAVIYRYDNKKYNLYLEHPDKNFYAFEGVPQKSNHSEIIVKDENKTYIINAETGERSSVTVPTKEQKKNPAVINPVTKPHTKADSAKEKKPDTP